MFLESILYIKYLSMICSLVHFQQFLYTSAFLIAQSAGALEYIDCTSAEWGGNPPPYECPVYDTKQSDGEVPEILGL